MADATRGGGSNGDAGRRLELARRELLDLGLRNSLINFRPLRARGVEIVGERPAQIFEALVREGRAMSFAPAPEPVNGEQARSVAEFAGLPPEPAAPPGEPSSRQTDLRLQTAHVAAQLQSRLLNTYYIARTVIEEQGANILYLALGMLEWFEADESQERRQAPLLLVPVELERANALDRFRVRYTGEDIGENLSLREKLVREFGISAPPFPDLDDPAGPGVEGYFADFQQAVAARPRWRVNAASVVLGFFSFGKFLMYRDLDVANWPEEGRPTEHHLLRALLGDELLPLGDRLDDNVFLDDVVRPGDLRQVVDADSSQTLAILDVNSGSSLVIQGPPGTGKSQTITNLIAEAVGRGQSVLFVAEKMAALEVVKRRLDHIGLGDACLELHSHKINKRGVLQELQRTLELGQPRAEDLATRLTLLEESRDRLNSYCHAINTPVGESGVTPYRVLGELARSRAGEGVAEWPRLEIPQLASWSELEFARAADLVTELQARLGRLGIPAEHPFWGVRRGRLLPSERAQLREELAQCRQGLEDLRAPVAAVAALLGLTSAETLEGVRRLERAGRWALHAPPVSDLLLTAGEWQTRRDEVESLLAAGTRLAELRERYDGSLAPEIWQEDLLTIRQDLASYGPKWWRFLSSRYRAAKATLARFCLTGLPDSLEAQLGLIDDVREARQQREVLQEHDALGAHLFGPHWRGERSDWPRLSSWAGWIVESHQEVAAGRLPTGFLAALEAILADSSSNLPIPQPLDSRAAELTSGLARYDDRLTTLLRQLEFDPERRFGEVSLDRCSLAELEAMLTSWHEQLDRLDEMAAFNASAAACQSQGLGAVAGLAERWLDAARHLLALLRRERAMALLERALRERPSLAEFSGSSHESVIERFRELDREVLAYNRAHLAHEHWRRVPRHSGGGQLGVLRREFEKKSRHLPVRQLVDRAGKAIQAIKPVFMMSPLSVAAFLPPGSLDFDVVIFDEASQVKPVDAFGAIARSQQAVVVGDSKQLPPTSFFDAIVQNEEMSDEETTTSDIESILGLFAAQSFPQRMLRWHYRSRHESLIAVSNHEFYDGRLVIFPSPDAARQDAGLLFHHLPQTSYDRGTSRKNLGEAQVVAQSVMRHAAESPQLTLGVAAFSVAQADAIREQIEGLRRQDPRFEDFFAAHPHEPFFVKNLENVQGDERDVIFVSVGYGRGADGYLSMNFGPLNGAQGERRLNVLITRARIRCEIFTNLTADDIDLNRSSAPGVVALKRYLHYAQTGILDVPQPSGREAQSPFEEAVRDALLAAGYQIETQVGSGGFFIDLAVVDPEKPGRYILGIECDGASYHSARSARDRDRLRQQVLEGLGWRLHRIWSTDWFHNPARELRQTIEAIEAARAARGPGRIVPPAAQQTMIDRSVDVSAPPSPASDGVAPYRTASLAISTADRDLSLVPRSRLAGWVVQVVEAESPIHRDEVMRRIADAAGVARIGGRIRGALDDAITAAAASGRIRVANDFLWSRAMPVPPLRERNGRSLEHIAPEEIALAVRKVVADAYGMRPDEVQLAALRLLGFQRVSEEARVHVGAIIEAMLAAGQFQLQGDHLSVV